MNIHHAYTQLGRQRYEQREEVRNGGQGGRKMRLRISNSHIGREREKDWRTGLDG